LDRGNFSVLFFYKLDRQRAPVLVSCGKTKTEKIEKDFSFFQFSGTEKDLTEKSSLCFKRFFVILRHRTELPGEVRGRCRKRGNVATAWLSGWFTILVLLKSLLSVMLFLYTVLAVA